MRLSNKKRLPTFSFIHTIVWIFLASGIVLFFIEKYKIDFLGWESSLFIIIPSLLIVLLWLRGKPIFEYDSDGETLTFNNYSVSPFLKKQKKDEFPKYKLEKFDVINFILIKKIIVTIHSKKNHHVILKYDISYLSAKEIRDLKFSLKKVIKNNQELQPLTTAT